VKINKNEIYSIYFWPGITHEYANECVKMHIFINKIFAIVMVSLVAYIQTKI
jgi:hypothetical protein